MYSTIQTALLDGIHTIPVSVEVDIRNGMPMFDMVGNLSSEVREAKERVKTALHNCAYVMPAKRVTVNLSPGNIHKSGTSFDLPIAIGLLVSMEEICCSCINEMLFAGELSLNGTLLPVNGILPIVADGKERGFRKFVVPADNVREAKLVGGVEIYAFSTLYDVIGFLKGELEYQEVTYNIEGMEEKETDMDFADVNGQQMVRRACEVAASGMHNLLMIGPPGAGKTMISERMSTILPPLTKEEQLELSKIYSVCGLLKNKNSLMTKRPFRSPHHTITKAGLAGGGATPRPGEISLAHHGVLFLDELTEFQKQVIEVMRQPLESHKIELVRTGANVTYPANFLLLAAMNPCNCGYYPNMQKCRCTPSELMRYAGRISQPLLDRIDICVETPVLRFDEIVRTRKNESSADMRKRVIRCHEIQRERYRGEQFSYNSSIPAASLSRYCALGEKEERYMEDIFVKMSLTGRTYHKILRVARTIADMEECPDIGLSHLMEAVCYRSLDQQFFWRASV